jgi:hypothetical protein
MSHMGTAFLHLCESGRDPGRDRLEAENDRLCDELAVLTRAHNLLHTRFTVLRIRFRRAMRHLGDERDRRWVATQHPFGDEGGPPDAA